MSAAMQKVGGLLACFALCVGTQAMACTNDNRIKDAINDVVDLPNELRPDIVLTSWRIGSPVNSTTFTGCPNGRTVNVKFSPGSNGLTYEREVSVEGTRYSAYGMGPTSPLVVFRLIVFAPGQGYKTVPAKSGNETRFQAVTGNDSPFNVNTLQVRVQYALVSRGGPMTSMTLPAHSAYTDLVDYSIPGVMHQVDIAARLPALTCTLTGSTLVLPDASALALAKPGDSAQARALNVAMNCPSAGIPVTLQLADATGDSGSDGQLVPAAGSTASGVRLQVLRNNVPVPFKRSWSHGASSAGNQNIAFTARYVRTTDVLKPGAILGEATLTATYN